MSGCVRKKRRGDDRAEEGEKEEGGRKKKKATLERDELKETRGKITAIIRNMRSSITAAVNLDETKTNTKEEGRRAQCQTYIS